MFVKLLSVIFWKKGPGFSVVPQSTNNQLVSPENSVRAGPGSLTPDLQSCQLENSEEHIYRALMDQNEMMLFCSLSAALYFFPLMISSIFRKKLAVYHDSSVWAGGRHNE